MVISYVCLGFVVLSFTYVAIKQNMISLIILPLNCFEPDLTQHMSISIITLVMENIQTSNNTVSTIQFKTFGLVWIIIFNVEVQNVFNLHLFIESCDVWIRTHSLRCCRPMFLWGEKEYKMNEWTIISFYSERLVNFNKAELF